MLSLIMGPISSEGSSQLVGPTLGGGWSGDLQTSCSTSYILQFRCWHPPIARRERTTLKITPLIGPALSWTKLCNLRYPIIRVLEMGPPAEALLNSQDLAPWVLFPTSSPGPPW